MVINAIGDVLIEENIVKTKDICIDCNYEVIHNNYTESIKTQIDVNICNECMVYKIKNKISFNKKQIKCKSSIFSYYKCYNEGTVLYNNENICKYHHDCLLGKYCDICGLYKNICLCNKDFNIINSDDEEYEDSEDDEIPKDPNKIMCIYDGCNNEAGPEDYMQFQKICEYHVFN